MQGELNQLKLNELTNQELDNINKIVDDIEKRKREKNLISKEDCQLTPEEWQEEIDKMKKGVPTIKLSQKINVIIAELEKERAKPPAIQYKEKEVVRLEPKCDRCKEKEYTAKLGQLRMITYGALAYSIIITIISIIKNEIVKSDFKTFLEQSWRFIQLMLKKANMGFLTLSSHIDNEIAQKIIHIGLWVLVAGAVGYGIYKLYYEMQYKTWKFWNIGAVGMVLLDLILIVYFSEPIKVITNLNLFIFALLVYAGYIIIRITVNIIKTRS